MFEEPLRIFAIFVERFEALLMSAQKW